MELYECHVVFINDRLGEFQYTVEARGTLPDNVETITKECVVEETFVFDLEVKVVNKSLMEALKHVSKDGYPMQNTKKKTVSSFEESKIVFNVESNKSYLQVPAQITWIGDGLKTQENNFMNSLGNASMNKLETVKLPIKFLARSCNTYDGDIIVRSADNPNDIRVYKVYVIVKPKNIEATIEFCTPIGCRIVQKIPIRNPSDSEWKISAELTDPSTYFGGPKEIKISRNETGYYDLSFEPKERIMKCEGKLRLINLNTKELYIYTLKGKIEEPLATGCIELSNVPARQDRKEIIEIPNKFDKDIHYTVETDLSEIISGMSTFTVRAGSVYKYELNIRPLLGKSYFGKITFIDKRKNYLWYTIKVDAISESLTKKIDLKSNIRKAVSLDIAVENPLNDNVIFDVEFEGEYLFSNEKEIRVEPKKTTVFTLFFEPLRIGIWNGRLRIYNERISEFIYDIRCTCSDNPQFYSDTILCELGKSKLSSVFLENPSTTEVKISYQNSNLLNYSIAPEKIYIPARASKEIIVTYTPSSLDKEEETKLIFTSDLIGNWVYNFRGKGITPGEMDPTVVSTQVGGMTSGLVYFKNPFKEEQTVRIELECDEWPGTFKLMKNKEHTLVEEFATLPIYFKFNPRKLTKYKACIIVYITKSLFWKFPLIGVTEVKSSGIDFYFKTNAKKQFETKVFLDLSDTPNESNDKFKFVTIVKEKKYEQLIQKCLKIEIESSQELKEAKKIGLNIKFFPLRPFKTDCEIIIDKQNAGQWIYNCILEATEPEPDDVINIQSSLHKTSTVCFSLNNLFTKNSRFIAFFSHDSSSEFSVAPSEGFLDQMGKLIFNLGMRASSSFLILPKNMEKLRLES